MNKKELEQAIVEARRILELSTQRPVSTSMKAVAEQHFGKDWKTRTPGLKRLVENQEALETKAIRIRRKDLQKLEAQLKK